MCDLLGDGRSGEIRLLECLVGSHQRWQLRHRSLGVSCNRSTRLHSAEFDVSRSLFHSTLALLR